MIRPLVACLLIAVAAPGATLAGAPAGALPARADALARILALADARRFDGDTLTAMVAHPDAAVRAATARLLGQLADPSAAGLLDALAGDRDPSVRAEAAAACGRLLADVGAGKDGAPLAATLRRLMADRAPKVRAAAAWGWGRSGRPESGDTLLGALGREDDPAARAAEVAELWRAKSEATAAAAAKALADASPEVRVAAAVSLGRSGGSAAVAALGAAAEDHDAAVREAVLDGLRRAAPADSRGTFAAALSDPQAAVRIAALGGLEAAFLAGPAGGTDRSVAATLARLVSLTDPTRVHERVMAIRAAGAGRCCREELRATVAGDSLWLAGEALVALARQGEAEAPARVDTWLGSTDPARRVAAVAAAAVLPDGAVRISALLGDAATEVRLAAAEQAAEMGERIPVAALRARLGDTDAAVRAAAIEALGKRGSLPDVAVLLELVRKEQGAVAPDAAVALVAALAAPRELAPAVRDALAGLVKGDDPVVARAAWDALRAHGVNLPLPAVATGHDVAFYRSVVAWAEKPRWLEIVTVRGTMQVRLDTGDAPLTCFRLAQLAGKGFFDDLTFHRVVPDFVVQGGDPRGDGWGGPGFVLRDELSLRQYLPGTVGMALAGPDTGGSQLFVTLTRRPHLDGRYPVLGEVAHGEDVAWRIRRGDRILRITAGEGDLPTFYPIWYGPLEPARLDAEIHGWRAERERYTPRAEWLARLATAKLRYGLDVAMGTWCGDSREQIPRLEKILATLGDTSPFDPPRLIGIDRSKEVDPKLFPFGKVELVPTIVVTAGGSEVGRIVETPKSGSLEEDLVRILAPIEGWSVPEPGPTPPNS